MLKLQFQVGGQTTSGYEMWWSGLWRYFTQLLTGLWHITPVEVYSVLLMTVVMMLVADNWGRPAKCCKGSRIPPHPRILLCNVMVANQTEGHVLGKKQSN